MSLDRLSLLATGDENSALMDSGTTPEVTASAVLEVLAGVPLREAAVCIHMEPTELAAAVEVYRQAGRQALEQQAVVTDWWQLYIEFADWTNAEKTAAEHLAPLLHRAEINGTLTTWWFIRKHPYWRLRLRTHPHSNSAKAGLGAALDDLVTGGHLQRWWPGIYEPETAAFGGATGIRVAHELFHADSRAIWDLPHHSDSTLGRRELSLLLCSILLRAAGLEWYERGDVWHHVAHERPLPTDIPPGRPHALAKDLTRLMLADTEPHGPLLGAHGPAAFAAEWAEAFRRTGRILGTAARAGTLDRGLRRVLAYHVIFHWNRLGLPTRTQSILAAAARAAILNPLAAHPARVLGE